jgi:hypothetical protein
MIISKELSQIHTLVHCWNLELWTSLGSSAVVCMVYMSPGVWGFVCMVYMSPDVWGFGILSWSCSPHVPSCRPYGVYINERAFSLRKQARNSSYYDLSAMPWEASVIDVQSKVTELCIIFMPDWDDWICSPVCGQRHICRTCDGKCSR